MSKNNLTPPFSGKEALKVCKKSDKVSHIEPTKGSHQKVFPKDTSMPYGVIPYHNSDLPKGTCCAILKWMKLVGIISVLVILMVYFSGVI